MLTTVIGLLAIIPASGVLVAFRRSNLNVSRKILDSLFKRGASKQVLSNAHKITVMLTDIVGFSAASKGIKAS